MEGRGGEGKSVEEKIRRSKVDGAVVQCTMYLTLHSFSLKLCSAPIDLKHSAVLQCSAAVQCCSAVQCNVVQCSAVQCSVLKCSALQKRAIVQCRSKHLLFFSNYLLT